MVGAWGGGWGSRSYGGLWAGVGVGGFWHLAFGVLFSSVAGGAYRPIAIRCPSLGPSPSAGGGAHQPLTTCALPLPPRPIFPSLPPPSLPSGGCANGAPGLALFGGGGAGGGGG